MRFASLLLDPRGRVDRRTYVLAGAVLLALKIALDVGVCAALGERWSPLLYLSPIWVVTPLPTTRQDPALLVALLAAALPFAWCGLALTLKRLRDAHSPAWLATLFVIPVLNWTLMLLAALSPTVVARGVSAPVVQAPRRPWSLSGIIVPAITAASVAAAAVLLSANLAGSYGLGLFIATPFIVGYVAVGVAQLAGPRSFGQSMGIAATAGFASALVLLALGVEGAMCVVMAAPLTAPLGMLGGVVAHVACAVTAEGADVRRVTAAMPLLIPAILGVERAAAPPPIVEPVTTAIDVAADPATVWRHVIAFPPLADPDEWLFRAGISYPIGATIDGVGSGAIRRCEFSTGAFVEPITTWDAGHELAFDVTSCPEPMIEWSPWRIHPRHLNGFMVSQRGRFRLIALPDGRTRLEGTTWYRHGLWPETYWRWWSDAIVHRIHRRVLAHVAALSERDARGGS